MAYRSLLFLGIMASRWRLLYTRIIEEPDKVVKLVKAMCVLHNYLRTNEDQRYTPPGFYDVVEADGTIREGFWRRSQVDTLGMDGHCSRSSTTRATQVREHLTAYFSSDNGSVPWQRQHVNAT